VAHRVKRSIATRSLEQQIQCRNKIPADKSIYCPVAPNSLGIPLLLCAHAGHPVPFKARESTLASQGGCSGLVLQIHHTERLLPNVTLLGGAVFCVWSHSAANFGLASDNFG